MAEIREVQISKVLVERASAPISSEVAGIYQMTPDAILERNRDFFGANRLNEPSRFKRWCNSLPNRGAGNVDMETFLVSTYFIGYIREEFIDLLSFRTDQLNGENRS